MNTISRKSLAGTGKSYVGIQFKMTPNGCHPHQGVHVQIAAPEGNRQYGWAFDVELDDVDLAMAQRAFNAASKNESFATDKPYAVAQATAIGYDEVHVQVAGESVNRDYGAALNWGNDAMREAILRLLSEPVAVEPAAVAAEVPEAPEAVDEVPEETEETEEDEFGPLVIDFNDLATEISRDDNIVMVSVSGPQDVLARIRAIHIEF